MEMTWEEWFAPFLKKVESGEATTESVIDWDAVEMLANSSSKMSDLAKKLLEVRDGKFEMGG